MIEATNETKRTRPVSTSSWFLLLVVVGFGLSSLVSKSPVPDAAWGSDLNAAQTIAGERGKPVLIQFTTDGCSYCVVFDPLPRLLALEQGVSEYVTGKPVDWDRFAQKWRVQPQS